MAVVCSEPAILPDIAAFVCFETRLDNMSCHPAKREAVAFVTGHRGKPPKTTNYTGKRELLAKRAVLCESEALT